MNSILQKYKDYLSSLNVSKVTEKSYISDIKQFLETKNINDLRDIKRLREDDIDIYVQSLSILKKPLTIKRKRSTLKHFLNFLKLTNLIDRPLSQKLPSSVISIPLSHLLILSYLIVFTIINGAITLSRKGASLQSVDEMQEVSSIPDNIKLREAQVVSMDEETNAGVFTISADDSINPFGQASIAQGQREVTIYNNSVTPSTFVFATPVSDLHNQSLYVKQVGKGSFTVGTTLETTADIYFNWLVRTPTVTIY